MMQGKKKHTAEQIFLNAYDLLLKSQRISFHRAWHKSTGRLDNVLLHPTTPLVVEEGQIFRMVDSFDRRVIVTRRNGKAIVFHEEKIGNFPVTISYFDGNEYGEATMYMLRYYLHAYAPPADGKITPHRAKLLEAWRIENIQKQRDKLLAKRAKRQQQEVPAEPADEKTDEIPLEVPAVTVEKKPRQVADSPVMTKGWDAEQERLMREELEAQNKNK